MSESVKPYQESTLGKKSQVADMFNSIAGKYDFLNHFLSMGIDVIWRKKAISLLKSSQPQNILDIATGTGDLAIEAANTIKNCIVQGIDISEKMMEVGRKKLIKRNLQHRITLELGDSENLNFPDNTFDAITVAFGVRNFENLEKGLSQMIRVLKPGGICVILEFSKPTTFPVKQLYNFYFNYILPFTGRFISRDKAAYSYLPASVEVFPTKENFKNMLKNLGLKNVKIKTLTFGIACIHYGTK